MEGKTIDKARAAQGAAHNAQKTGGTSKACNNHGSTTQSQSQSPSSGDPKSIMVNGKCYMLTNNTSNSKATTESAMSAITIPMPTYDEEEYIAVLATIENPYASLDWATHSRPHDIRKGSCRCVWANGH
jgi:hypothetical protein